MEVTSLGRRNTEFDCVNKDHQRVSALHFLFVAETGRLNLGEGSIGER